MDVPAELAGDESSGTPTVASGTHPFAFAARGSTTAPSSPAISSSWQLLHGLIVDIPLTLPPPPFLLLPTPPPSPRWEDAPAEAVKQSDPAAARAASLVTPSRIRVRGTPLAEVAAGGSRRARDPSATLSDPVGAPVREVEGLAVQDLPSVLAHGLDLIQMRCCKPARCTVARVPDGAPLVCPSGQGG